MSHESSAHAERVSVTPAERPTRHARVVAVVRRATSCARAVRATAAAIGLVLLMATAAAAQDPPTPVERIRADPQASADQVVTIVGVVDRLVSREGAGTPAYYLEDDYGHQILVVPLAVPPSRGERVRVTGVVTLDAVGDPVVTALDSTDLAAAMADAPADADAPPDGDVPADAEAPVSDAPAPVAASPDGAPPTSAEGLAPVQDTRSGIRAFLSSPFRFVLIGVGGLLAIVVVVAAIQARLRAIEAPRPLVTAPRAHQDVDFETGALWPESDQAFEGRTMKFVRPDATARLLPAKLEVIGGGDAGEEIRFVGVEGEPLAMMFGRAPGEGPSHIQLKQKTVSRTHAIIRHRHGEWLLENLSMTNPTVLNDEVLGVKERLLTDGDRIEMGEVTFRFRSA